PRDGIRRLHVTGVQTCALPLSFFRVSWPVVSDAAGSPVFAAAVSAAVGGGDSADVGDGWPADPPLSPAPREVGVADSRFCVADRFVPEHSDSVGGRE